MRTFSIIFTVLFFLSFTSITYAEYTITNKSNSAVVILMSNPLSDNNRFELDSNECLKLKESEFYNLIIFVYTNKKRTRIITLCDEDFECEPSNYEVSRSDLSKRSADTNHYKMMTVDQTNTSETCHTTQT